MWEGKCPVCGVKLRLRVLPSTTVICPNRVGGCGRVYRRNGRWVWNPTRLQVRVLCLE